MSLPASETPLAQRIRSASRKPFFYLWLVLLVYGLLLAPTVTRQGISWDEQTDLDIARSYISRPDGWLRGSESDPSQTRLPMYVVAVVYTLLNTDDLYTARLVSCLVGALTIVGVYMACVRDYDHRRGVLAGAILATSPFFLSFARTAFTETDVYVACAFSWLVVCLSHLREKGTIGWAAVTGIVLGLGLSVKFTAVVLFPAVLLQARSFPRVQASEALPRREVAGGAALLSLMAGSMLFGWAGINATAPMFREGWLLRFHACLALIGWALVLAWAARKRDRAAQPLTLAGLVILLSLGTFMVLPPVHTTNPSIIASLIERFNSQVGWNPCFTWEAAVLHLACVVFKSSPLIGIGLLVGVVATLVQWKAKPGSRFPLLVVLFYFLGLVLLPIAQTFYMVPLLPILAILASDQLLTLWPERTTAAVIAGAAAVVLIVDLFRCYPDYNLNGYQWLGARYLAGRPTIGYRSVVQTTSDGVQQVVGWLCDNATHGERVVAYVYPWHIVEAACPRPSFRISHGSRESVRSRPDYVITHINHEIRAAWSAWLSGRAFDVRAESVFWEPYDTDWLHSHFTKVATVRRAFGVEMASIWERNDRLRE
jgi:4-amino-4-deoxy-L-arabinose transferase-like glycosyltransferase